jgi:hypothetical protein
MILYRNQIGAFAAAYSLYGGLSVAWTDVIQVIFFEYWWLGR